MAFRSSLTHTGTRIGGQRERQIQAYEAGTAYFPRDFPFSPAYESWAKERGDKERGEWVKKPPAKRVNYAKLGVRSPWKADWDVVLGLKEAELFVQPEPERRERKKGGKRNREAQELVSTQRDDGMDVDVDMEEDEDVEIPEVSMKMDVDELGLKPWLLWGPEMTRILSTLGLDPAANLLKEINKLRQKRSLEPLNPMINANDFLKHVLVNVKVIMFKEGVPEDLAMIYHVSDEEAATWEQLMAGKKVPEGNSVTNVLQVSLCFVDALSSTDMM